MTKTISSQRYRNDDIVEEKRAAKDYTVMVSPTFVFDGIEMRVVLDGHHSYSAAVIDGAEIDWVEATGSEHDAVTMLETPGNEDDFLLAVHMGNDYHDIQTGVNVW